MKTIAVIGCGRIANNMHFRAFAEMQDIIRITRFGSDEEIKNYSRKV